MNRTLCRIIPLLVALLLPSAYAQRITVTEQVGSVEVPAGWNRTAEGNAVVYASTDPDLSQVRLYALPGVTFGPFLHRMADSLAIPRNIRRVSAEFTADAGAEKGAFILGTTPVDSTEGVLPSPPDYADLSPTWLSDREGTVFPATYRFVAVYEDNDSLFVMEARSRDLNSSPWTLSDIHRSWVLPR